MRSRWLWMLALLCLCPAGRAAADWLDELFPPGVPGYGAAPGVTVVSRLRPETQPEGIRAGSFVLHPTWSEATGYDDNVLGGPSPQGSWVVTTSPSLLLSSDWSRDAFGAYVAADDRRDLDLPAQSRTDWTGSLGGSLDFGPDRLTLAAAHVTGHEDRTALDALPTDQPILFEVEDARASYAWAFGPWTLTSNLDASDWRYGSATIRGAPADQSYRDRTVLQGGVTLAYELAPQRSLVLVTRAITQDYPHRAPGQPTLDSTGFQVLAGIDYADDAVWRYRLLAGGEQRDFADSAYPARMSVIAEGQIAWMPSGMTTVIGSLTRSVEDAAQEGVAGFTRTAATLSVDHEMRRDVLLHASAGLQRADFLNGGGQQDAFTAGVAATWLANRHWQVSATYDLTMLRGSTTLPLIAGNYNQGVAMVTVRVGW